MIVFSMYNHHLGDVVMAMPAAEKLLASGHEVGILIDKKYMGLFAGNGVQHIDKFSRKHAHLRRDMQGGEHQTDMWMRVAGLGKPSRIKVLYEVSPLTEQMTGKWFVMAPWVAGSLKVWTPEGYAAAADYAASLGYNVAVVGPKSARPLVDRIKARMTSVCVDFVGQDTTKDWPSFFAKASIVLCPDTGTAHVADAVGAKTIALFGWLPSPTVFTPYWSQQHTVNFRGQGMHNIPIQAVLDKIKGAHDGMG